MAPAAGLAHAATALSLLALGLNVETRLRAGGLLTALPLPWLASEAGWFVAEYGRQPWAIGEILPTHMAVSQLTVTDIWISLGTIVVLYTIFVIIEMWLMTKYARLGPSSLHIGKYDLETPAGAKEA